MNGSNHLQWLFHGNDGNHADQSGDHKQFLAPVHVDHYTLWMPIHGHGGPMSLQSAPLLVMDAAPFDLLLVNPSDFNDGLFVVWPIFVSANLAIWLLCNGHVWYHYHRSIEYNLFLTLPHVVRKETVGSVHPQTLMGRSYRPKSCAHVSIHTTSFVNEKFWIWFGTPISSQYLYQLHISSVFAYFCAVVGCLYHDRCCFSPLVSYGSTLASMIWLYPYKLVVSL